MESSPLYIQIMDHVPRLTNDMQLTAQIISLYT